MQKIRTTVPKLPEGMKQERGCGLCGKSSGNLTASLVTLDTLPGKPKRFLWTCKGGCRK